MKIRYAAAAGALLLTGCTSTASVDTPSAPTPTATGGGSGSSAAAAFCADYAQFLQDTNAVNTNAIDGDEQKMDAAALSAGNPFEADITQGQTTGSMGPAQQDCTNAGYGSDF